MTAPHPRAAGGFTLIEVLAALAVASMVLLLIGQMQRFGIDAIARQTGLMHDGRALRQADDLIRQALIHMDPGTRAQPEAARGGGSHILFRTNWPADASALCELGIDDSRRLMLRCAPPGPNPVWRDIALAQGVARLELRYRGDAAPADWLAAWNGPGNPRLVRIAVAWTDPARRPWPAMIASPLRLEPAD